MNRPASSRIPAQAPEIGFGFVGVTQEGFDMDLARHSYSEAKHWLQSMESDGNVRFIASDDVFTETGRLERFLADLQGQGAAGLVLQTSTFATGELALAAAAWAKRHQTPVVLWGLPEPPGGGILRANSFCACNFYASVFRAAGVKYKWIFGGPQDEAVRTQLLRSLTACSVLSSLRGATVGLVGSSRVPGFYGSNFDEFALKEKFGLAVRHVDLADVFALADRAGDGEIRSVLDELLQETRVEEGLDEKELARSARLTVALRKIAETEGHIGLAVKCWPDFSLHYGAAVCASMAMLSNDGVITSDEGDMWGLVTELCSSRLGDDRRPPTLLDAVGFDSGRNQVHLWHCGATSWDLGRAGTQVGTCRHFNQTPCGGCVNSAAVSELLLEHGPVTLARLTGLQGDHLLVAEGEIEESPVSYRGAFGAVRLDGKVADFVSTVMSYGCEHHYALSYGRLAALWRELAYWASILPLNLEATRDRGQFGLPLPKT